jgi:hypothetical protein
MFALSGSVSKHHQSQLHHSLRGHQGGPRAAQGNSKAKQKVLSVCSCANTTWLAFSSKSQPTFQHIKHTLTLTQMCINVTTHNSRGNTAVACRIATIICIHLLESNTSPGLRAAVGFTCPDPAANGVFKVVLREPALFS